ncbi:MAG TPA: arginine deiminase-related protein [Acidimicrobiales bacterium]|nr:arginine deiminase-related protein [Acidimicrobiales bacterium]
MAMTSTAARHPQPGDAYRPRRVLMCRPDYFAVSYEINPWMHTGVPVDRRLAIRQWESIVRTYEALGHTVEFVEPVLGLPDMVFVANAGLVVGGCVYRARFRYRQRQGEEAPYTVWFRRHFDHVVRATEVNEGEGDFAVVGDTVFAGYGFRTDLAAHDELRAQLHVPVVSLRLVDPRFYHLDTALAVLRDDHVAYFPGAFDAASRAVLAERFPDAVLVDEHDAEAFGCNAMSDGHHVVVSAQATGFVESLRAAGYDPVPLDTSELRKAGGSVKCCTLELRENDHE